MSVEITPVGIACNLKCAYCYQHAQRNAGNINRPLDEKAIIRQLDAHCGKGGFSLFGGECLLAPVPVLERFFRYGLDKFNQNGIQTNGTLITDDHIALFKRYKVHVGFSIDGPDELNSARCGTELTRLANSNLLRCLAAGVQCSIILTLTTKNVGEGGKWALFNRLWSWIADLDSKGLRGCRLHTLEVDTPEAEKLKVPDWWMVEVLKLFWDLQKYLKHFKFDKFKDIETLILSQDHPDVTCIWNGCDPLNTSAVVNISADGEISSCGRAHKDGTPWRKTRERAATRTTLLYNTPYVDGGCQDCRFFDACRGYCPGTGIDGDWRNRSVECGVIRELFQYGEHKVGKRFSRRYNPETSSACSSRNLNSHGDVPHGDSHGDHTDTGIL